MDTLSLYQSISRLRLLVTGAADHSAILVLIDQMLRELATQYQQNTSTIKTLQKELSQAQKKANTLL